jgi:hypothetical protein
MSKPYVLFLLVLCSFTLQAQQRYVISGFIKDAASKELLIGASVAIPKHKTGTATNAYGFFSITIPADTVEVIVTYVGYAPKAFNIVLDKNQELNIELSESNKLKEVVVSGDRVDQRLAQQTRMSVIEIPVSQIRDIPALLGEKDVLKVIQLLPGVQKPSEGNSGIYVRGGGPDQNLIILDEAIVYNAFHLFGFFSLFNGDALKSIELTKGGFPARYGGRLSSVIDMNMKEGNKQKIGGEAGIGSLSSRLLLEGPIIKNKSSFLVSGRRTYFDVLTTPFLPESNKGGYYFYDLNAKANYELNNRNRLYVSGYFGRDKFWFRSKYNSNKEEGNISWGNATATLRWNHLYNNKTFSNTSAIFSDYSFGIGAKSVSNGSTYELKYASGIRDYAVKHDIDYRPGPNHTIRGGLHLIYHQFTPSAVVIKDSYIGQDTSHRSRVESFENAVYVEDDIKVGPKFRVNPGIRLSHFSAAKKNYINFEPRISTSYNLRSDLAIKASYALMNQYIHLLSNTGIGLPTDLWVPSTDKLKPQRSWQLAAGIAKDYIDQNFNVSIEGYYKEMNNIISYREGASFLDTDPTASQGSFSWEKNITSGRGWSYGAEFLLQRKTGRLTGWIGYTLSWTQWQFDELNFGKKFWARYDRRHDISVVGIYTVREESELRNGIKISATWVYGTGNAITLPVANYDAPVHSPSGSSQYFYGDVSQYTDKNAFRMGAYHRGDIGIQVTKKMPKWSLTCELSIYNIYNRKNPYFYYSTTTSGGETVLKQISLFPIIPSLTWNAKF